LIEKYKSQVPIIAYKKMADNGSKVANYAMAMEALKLNKCDIVKKRLQNSAKKGYQKAINRIAILKYQGRCWDKNIQEAKELFLRSIKKNIGCSDETLKAIYMYANIIYYDEKNYNKALKLYQSIDGSNRSEFQCTNTNSIIQAYSAYMAGFILEQVFNATSESFIKYQHSAQMGYNKAQYKLGILYAKGVGVRQDLYQAKLWLDKSANNGYEKAKREMNRYGLDY
jgi:TPR repeat protein